jgi:hypothetical protein
MICQCQWGSLGVNVLELLKLKANLVPTSTNLCEDLFVLLCSLTSMGRPGTCLQLSLKKDVAHSSSSK